jgi:hypothetical protein
MNSFSAGDLHRTRVTTTGLHEELFLIERAAEAYARARREVFDTTRSGRELTQRQHELLGKLERAEEELRLFRMRRMLTSDAEYADAG